MKRWLIVAVGFVVVCVYGLTRIHLNPTPNPEGPTVAAAPTEAAPTRTVAPVTTPPPSPERARIGGHGAKVAAVKFTTAYLNVDAPHWRRTYGRFTTDHYADLLSTVPKAVVEQRPVNEPEMVSAGLGYARLHIRTGPDVLLVSLVREPSGWKVASAAPDVDLP